MLVPKRTKFRKMQKGRIRGNATRGTKLVHGDYGIVALEPTFITNNQIESSGKGNPEYFVAVVKPGRVMFEIAGLDEATSREALRKAIQKLPIKCKVLTKEESLGGNDSEE